MMVSRDDHKSWTSGNWKHAWYGQMSRPSHWSLHQEELTFGQHPRKRTIRNAWFGSNSETRGRFRDGSGSTIVVQYSIGSIITLYGRITARSTWTGWVIRRIPWSGLHFRRTLQFSTTTMPLFTAGAVQSWLEEHEGELQHLPCLPWPAQSTDLNITEPLWSVLEPRLRIRFPPPTFLTQVEDVLREEW
jgi:hypothetical protein